MLSQKISNPFLNLILLLSLTHLSFSRLCAEVGDFQTISFITPYKFKVSPGNEICLKYKLDLEKKGKIGLYFKIGNSYTGQVLIYKSQTSINFNKQKNSYEDYFLEYSIGEESFKEINTKSFNDYVYIIIRDKYKYYFNDYLVIYDSSKVITLKDKTPLLFPYFLSTRKYEFTFSSSNNFTIVYNGRNQTNKVISAEFEGEEVDIENNYTNSYMQEFEPRSSRRSSRFYFTVELDEDQEDIDGINEFSIAIYSNMKHFREIPAEKHYELNYSYYKGKQEFYFYYDISSYNESATVNFRFDFLLYRYNGTNIISKIIHSDEELSREDFEEFDPDEENLLPYAYDRDSDEFLKIYFNDKKKSKYKYILTKVELLLNKLNYTSPRQITVSISEKVEVHDLTNIEEYKAKEISQSTDDYCPAYFKLFLNKKSTYVLTVPYQGFLTFIKGDILDDEGEINKDYIEEEKDIMIIKGISELTVRVFGPEKTMYFNCEKINPDYVIINEKSRDENPIQISMTDKECNQNVAKYLLGTYNKDKYSYGARKVNGYIIQKDDNIMVYYKNKISLENKSIFPSSTDDFKTPDKFIVMDSNIDLFKFKCKGKGEVEIRLQKKTYSETTHLITQNSFKSILLEDDTEILQLSSPKDLFPSPNYLYLSILSKKGNPVTISPDTKGVIKSITIEGTEVFLGKIDLSKYRMDQLALKVNTSSATNIEVMEVVSSNYTKYTEIEKETGITEMENINSQNLYRHLNPEKDKFIELDFNGLPNKTIISYTIVNLPVNDSNYFPLATKFENFNSSSNSNIKIENPLFNKTSDFKKYQVLLISILGYHKDLTYKLKIEVSESEVIKPLDDTLMNIFLGITIGISFIVAIITFILIRKKKGISVETTGNQSLFPSSEHEEN